LLFTRFAKKPTPERINPAPTMKVSLKARESVEALGECHTQLDHMHVLHGWSIVFASVVTIASGAFI
jgi:hypothetical protein